MCIITCRYFSVFEGTFFILVSVEWLPWFLHSFIHSLSSDALVPRTDTPPALLTGLPSPRKGRGSCLGDACVACAAPGLAGDAWGSAAAPSAQWVKQGHKGSCDVLLDSQNLTLTGHLLFAQGAVPHSVWCSGL